MYVALSGNIGSGKSTWTVRLAEILRVPAFPERPELNPWFAEPDLAALEEMRFVVSSATDVAALHAGRDGGVVERVPAEHVAIFGAVKRELGLLDDDELALIEGLHRLVAPMLPPPDVVVRLEAPCEELLHRVRARARHGEDGIGLELLESLRTRYDEFFAGWSESPVVRVDTAKAHPDRQDDVDDVTRRIREALP